MGLRDQKNCWIKILFFLFSVFWFLFLVDSFLLLFCFSFFCVFWLFSFLVFCLFCFFVFCGFFLVFEFCFSHFLDGFWFFFSFLFLLVFIYRLFLLMYFGSCGFLSFDCVKLFGFQWYWLYFLCLDSVCVVNLLLESDYFVGDLRLLQLTQFLCLLTFCLYKFWLSSVDVIHSFTLPCLGVKVDCLPGRCNELLLFTTCLGLFYGQCSELCGVLHGFMPLGFLFL